MVRPSERRQENSESRSHTRNPGLRGIALTSRFLFFYCNPSSCDIDFQESWGLKFFPIERGPRYLRSKSIHRVEE
jgi:hypothetical protein